MAKFKKVLLLTAMLAITVCASLALVGCGNSDNYPAYRNPLTGGGSGKYLVNVQSMGGLPLNGVVVSVKLNGSTVVSGVSRNGQIELNLSSGEYDLVVDESTLPEGYYIPSDVKFKTSAESPTATVAIPSGIISTTASSGTRYALGDVMHNFSFMDTDGKIRTLADVLATKKAVMLNFWFASCGPCQTEFPVIQKAYEAYSDKISIIALTNQDTLQEVTDFKNKRNLTFYMASDQSGITSMFNVTAFPTTIIIDRYGVVAARESTIYSEATWTALFNKFTADDYTQNAPAEDENPTDPVEQAKPDPSLVQPSSAEIEEVVLNQNAVGKVTNFRPETNESDAEYSFPWLIDNDKVYASNKKVPYSYAIMYCDVSLELGDILSYDYSVDTESGYDLFYTLIDGQLIGTHSGNSNGWKTNYAAFVANRKCDITLAFCYIKDQQRDAETDIAAFRNISITNVRDNTGTFDQLIAATEGKTLNSAGNYDLELLEPGTAENPDIYYHVRTTDGGQTKESILLIDILKNTYWTDKHIGKKSFIPEENAYNYSLYNISFWFMSNYATKKADEDLIFSYGYSNQIIEADYLQQFSDNTFMPVTADMKKAAVAFTKRYCSNNKLEYYEGQWLEMCYYYVHHGDKELLGSCNMTDDPVKNMAQFNASPVTEGKNVRVSIKNINTYNGGGLWYTFTPSQTAIYNFYSILIPKATDNEENKDESNEGNDAENNGNDEKKETDDPAIEILDLDYNLIGSNDNDESYLHFSKESPQNFNLYVKLEKGKTYFIHACSATAGYTAEYYINIEAIGQSFDYLRVCSTADGLWLDTYTYGAIKVAKNPSDGLYYEVTADYEYGSKIYIDLIHPNFFDMKDHSLYELAYNGYFDFTANFDKDYTQVIMQYYYKSISGKPTHDELYGMVEADDTLREILNKLFLYQVHEPGEAWLMFANYYVHYSV